MKKYLIGSLLGLMIAMGTLSTASASTSRMPVCNERGCTIFYWEQGYSEEFIFCTDWACYCDAVNATAGSWCSFGGGGHDGAGSAYCQVNGPGCDNCVNDESPEPVDWTLAR